MQQRYLLVSILIGGTSFPAFGQDAGSLLSDRLRVDKPEFPPLPVFAPEHSMLPQPEESGSVHKVRIKTIRFGGSAGLLTDAQRAELSSTVVGTDVGMAEIGALTQSANSRLWQNGYLLARAIIPPQDTSGGVLTLSVFEGAIDHIAFEFDERVRAKPEILKDTAERHIDQERFNNNELDSALRRMNAHPGVNAHARLAPGKRAGSTNLVVEISQTPVFGGSFTIDNLGSPSTGRLQASARMALTDITGNGDLTRLGALVSRGQRYATATHVMPIRSGDLLATFDYGYLHYENIDRADELATLRGSAHYAAVGLTKHAVRSREHDLSLSAMLNGKLLRDHLGLGRRAQKRSISGILEIDAKARDAIGGGGVTVVSASWTLGRLADAKSPLGNPVGARSQKTQGKFHRANADIARLQKLPGNFKLYANISGQWTNRILDSSESFSLGGAHGVRGWALGEARGDKGLLGRVELRYDAPLRAIPGSIQLSAFADNGRVWAFDHKDGALRTSALKSRSYSISGVGANVAFQRKNMSMSVGWSQGFAKNDKRIAYNAVQPGRRAGRQKLWLAGSFKF